MEYDGDQGASGFEDMNFGAGNMGSNVKFSFNGQDMNGMGIDPSVIFQQFFGNGGNFEAFSRMGRNQEKCGKRSQSNSKGFGKFGNFAGFGGFGGFNQGQSQSGFENFNFM